MESLKKIISLSQGAELSGYSQDYLGFLIRKGELKGIKKGRSWFTTEEEINNYLFKKKVRHQEYAIREFFSTSRTRNIIFAAVIIFVVGFFLFSDLDENNKTSISEIQSAITSDGEGVKIIKN